MNARRPAVICGLAFLVGAAWLAPRPAQAADPKDGEGVTTKSEDGLRFRLPPDWPIEKRNGMTGPIPVEEYLARKFSALDNRLNQLESQLTSIDLRLRVVEEAEKKQQSLKSREAAP